MPLVSVIIPCYNQSRYLGDALTSLTNQAFVDWEAIIVDDGSDDAVDEAVAPFATADPRFRLLRQTNQGVAEARNTGIQEARGALLSFLDADDWFGDNLLSELTTLLSDSPEVALAYCDIIMEYQDGIKPEPYSVGKSRAKLNGDILGSLLAGGYFPPHAVLVRRSAVEACGHFRPEMGGHADYDLWLRLAATGFQARYVDNKLVHYRIHTASMSRDFRHMSATRQLALNNVTEQFPSRVASSLGEIGKALVDLTAANQWLNQHVRLLDTELQQANRSCQDQQAWITELTTGLEWMDSQRQHWEAETHRRDITLGDLQAWAKELQSGTDWLESQRRMWEERANQYKAEVEVLRRSANQPDRGTNPSHAAG